MASVWSRRRNRRLAHESRGDWPVRQTTDVSETRVGKSDAPFRESRALNPARGPSDGRGRFTDVLLTAFSDGGPGGTRTRSGVRPPLPLGPASEAGFLGPLVAVVRIALTFRAYETRTGAAAVTASGAPSGAPACAYAQRRVLGRRGREFSSHCPSLSPSPTSVQCSKRWSKGMAIWAKYFEIL